MLQQELPYSPDTAAVFAPLADLPWAVWLDSCQPLAEQGRYDIISAAPLVTLQTQGAITEIRRREVIEHSDADPLFLLQQELAAFSTQQTHHFPFAGGAIGYFAYDLAHRWMVIPSLAQADRSLPDMAMGIYTWALLVDHQKQQSFLLAQEFAQQAFDYWCDFLSRSRLPTARHRFQLLDKPQADFSQAAYAQAFRRIQAYILEGDCYQVNLAQRFVAPARGHAWALYVHLREQNPAPFAAFLSTPQACILSSSPERFLAVRDKQVETKPIKGTRPRCLQDAARDAHHAAALFNSAKDRAENVMIVDLLRNDLSKVCELGSVHVPQLFALETFARVHHLVSTVTGRLAADKTALDLLRACFPGGSITGAPKLRAMQIIEELEAQRRGIYCGSIGYLGFDGNMDSNIAIRTLVYTQQELRFGVGGGIVADSQGAAEYQEALDKAAAIFTALADFQADR